MNSGPEPESESTEPLSARPPRQEDVLGRRIGAALIDLALMVAVFAILAATIGESTVEGGELSFELTGAEGALYLALVLLYYFALEAAIGQTVGKLLLGLRVVRTGGRHPSTVAIAVRTLLRVVDWLPFLYLVGFISMMATGARRQRLGDLAAKTGMGQAPPVKHRGLAAAATALVVVLLLGFSSYRAAVSGGGTSTQEGLSDLRVCADEAFDEGEEECTQDQREQPPRGQTFYCSAKVGDREGERVNARVLYEDDLYFTSDYVLPAGSGTVWVRFAAGNVALPAGPWACELAVGSEKLEASFESVGPTAPILNTAACPTANTVSETPPVCRQDESGAPLATTDSVTCSATIVGEKGKLVRAEFLYEGREIGGPPAELVSPGSIARVSIPLTAEPNLLPGGDYACRFSLANGQIGEKRFSITGGDGAGAR